MGKFVTHFVTPQSATGKSNMTTYAFAAVVTEAAVKPAANTYAECMTAYANEVNGNITERMRLQTCVTTAAGVSLG